MDISGTNMTTNNDTTGWKQRAIEEHILHQEAEQKLNLLSTELTSLQQQLRNTTDYNEFFEQKFYALEAKYQLQEQKLIDTVNILKKAQVLIKTRKSEMDALLIKHTNTIQDLSNKVELLATEKAELNIDLLRKAEIINEKSAQLEQVNYNLTATIVENSDLTQVIFQHEQKIKQLHAELDAELNQHQITSRDLTDALYDLDQANDLNCSLQQELAKQIKIENLDEYFVYKVLDSTAINHAPISHTQYSDQ